MDASMCVCLAPRGDVAGAPVAPSPTPAPRIPHARPANRSVPAPHMGRLRCCAASETEGPPPSCRTCMHGALNAWRASVWQRRVCSCSLEVSMCIHAPLWQPVAKFPCAYMHLCGSLLLHAGLSIHVHAHGQVACVLAAPPPTPPPPLPQPRVARAASRSSLAPPSGVR